MRDELYCGFSFSNFFPLIVNKCGPGNEGQVHIADSKDNNMSYFVVQASSFLISSWGAKRISFIFYARGERQYWVLRTAAEFLVRNSLSSLLHLVHHLIILICFSLPLILLGLGNFFLEFSFFATDI